MDYSKLPEHMQGAMQRYIEHGIAPGGFLTSVLCNDLKGAIGRADSTNRDRLADYVMFLQWDVPSTCHGSPEKVQAWIDGGGMQGRQDAAA